MLLPCIATVENSVMRILIGNIYSYKFDQQITAKKYKDFKWKIFHGQLNNEMR